MNCKTLLVLAAVCFGVALCSSISTRSNGARDKVVCETEAYPPDVKLRPQLGMTVVNLDLPPTKRYSAFAKEKSAELKNLIEKIIDLVKSLHMSLLIDWVDSEMPKWLKYMPYPFADEMRGIAEASGVPVGRVVLFNVFYEVFTVCTSVLAKAPDGKLYHGRNLDFGLFMGYDHKNHTWAVSEALHNLTTVFDFQRGGKTVFKSVGFLGYVGVLTAMHPNEFTLSVNERFSVFDGGYIGLLEWLMGDHSAKWMGFLTRQVAENATSFDDAYQKLTSPKLLAPVYFILGGMKPDQAVIVTRARAKPVDIWHLNETSDKWFLLETNYDHWKKPSSIDNRRDPGMMCMRNMTQANLSFKGLFNVLTTKPVLNQLTVYSSLMQVNTGKLEAYLQHCPQPCPLF